MNNKLKVYKTGIASLIIGLALMFTLVILSEAQAILDGSLAQNILGYSAGILVTTYAFIGIFLKLNINEKNSVIGWFFLIYTFYGYAYYKAHKQST